MTHIKTFLVLVFIILYSVCGYAASTTKSLTVNSEGIVINSNPTLTFSNVMVWYGTNIFNGTLIIQNGTDTTSMSNLAVGGWFSVGGNQTNSGTMTATSYYGDGSTLTGVGGLGDAVLGGEQTWTGINTFSNKTILSGEWYIGGGSVADNAYILSDGTGRFTPNFTIQTNRVQSEAYAGLNDGPAVFPYGVTITGGIDATNITGTFSQLNAATMIITNWFVITNASPPTVTGESITMWNSNGVLYGVSAFATNLIKDMTIQE